MACQSIDQAHITFVHVRNGVAWQNLDALVQQQLGVQAKGLSADEVEVIKGRLSYKSVGSFLFLVLVALFIVAASDKLFDLPPDVMWYFLFYLMLLVLDVFIATIFSRKLTQQNA